MSEIERYFALLKNNDIMIISYTDPKYDIIFGSEKKKAIARFIRNLTGRSGKFESYKVISGQECLLSLGIDPKGKLSKTESQFLRELNNGDEFIALRRDHQLDSNDEDHAILFTYDTASESS